MIVIYRNLWASIIRFAQDQIAEITDEGLSPNLGFVDWDSHADIHELPNTDLLGPSTFGISEDEAKMISLSFCLAVSTYDDKNLFRLRQMAAHLFEKMRPTKTFAYYNHEREQLLGRVIFTDGTTVPPVNRAEVRPFLLVQGQAVLEPFAAHEGT